MNIHEWPLVIFTVLCQSAVGAFLWCMIALCTGNLNTQQRTKLNRVMFLIWALVGVALALSTMHLGMPFRAANALTRTGQAPLSNEIISLSAFAGLGFIYWLMSLRKPEGCGAGMVLAALTAIAGLVFIWAMSNVYRIPTVPMWNTPMTCLAFSATAMICGSALAAFLLSASDAAHKPLLRYGPLAIATVGAIATIVVMVTQYADLANMQNAPLRDIPVLLKTLICFQSSRFVLLLIGLLIWGWQAARTKQSAGVMLLVSILLILAEMIGRLVFYSLNMTVGLI